MEYYFIGQRELVTAFKMIGVQGCVAGNVEDGFSVKASGKIEVHGTVGKAEIDAEGDIIVNQGITGRNEAKIRAGRSLWSRFIENATVSAGELIIVSDGIMNSNVSSKKKINQQLL